MTSARHRRSSGVRDQPYLVSYHGLSYFCTLGIILQYLYLVSIYDHLIQHYSLYTANTQTPNRKTRNKTQNMEDRIQPIFHLPSAWTANPLLVPASTVKYAHCRYLHTITSEVPVTYLVRTHQPRSWYLSGYFGSRILPLCRSRAHGNYSSLLY